MPKLDKDKLSGYDRDFLQSMAADLAVRVFGVNTARQTRDMDKDRLIKFILDNQDD